MKLVRIKSAVVIAAIAGAVAAFVTPSVRASDILIENVTLIDGTGAAPLPNASVLIKGDRIDLISPAPLKHEAGVQVIDGKGKFLIPGLIDTHIHLQGGRLQKDGKFYTDRALGLNALQGYLYSGVTSVYDASNNPDFLFPLRDDERSGKIVSPRIFATGSAVTNPGGYGATTFSLNIADWETGKPMLEKYLERKPDLLKILLESGGSVAKPDVPQVTMPPELVKQVAHFANEHGVRTTVHISKESDAWIAMDAGIDEMAHPVRGEASDDYIDYVATKHIPVCTTLAVFAYIADIGIDASFLDQPLYKATLDPAVIQAQKTTERQRYIDSGMSGNFQKTNLIMAKNVKRLFDKGAILALGTDRTWGPTVHLELQKLHDAGIPLFDLVKIGTLNAAIYLGKDKDLGSIQRGKLADLVLLKADPTKDVKNFQAIDAVFKGGEKIDLAKLDLPVNKK